MPKHTEEENLKNERNAVLIGFNLKHSNIFRVPGKDYCVIIKEGEEKSAEICAIDNSKAFTEKWIYMYSLFKNQCQATREENEESKTKLEKENEELERRVVNS